MSRRKAILGRRQWWLCRAAWCVMLISHAVWLVRSLVSPESGLGSSMGLLLATLFFVLKAIDVEVLRFQGGARPLMAGILVVVLLHAGAIERLVDAEGEAFPWTLPVLFSTALWFKLRRMPIMCRLEALLCAWFGRRRVAWTPTFWRVRGGVLIRRHQHFLIAQSLSRAPPA